ncbi:MAG: polysaccharide deacetylase family protein, partial [Alicyclobacillus sp.]|nr:polysaccharide deacetylase family protein [Alicyclobacillus sp.]
MVLSGRVSLALLLVLLAAALVYALLPNIWTRVLGRGGVRLLPGRPVVYLTFDDGPDPRYTGRLLDALAASRVPATFFVLSDKALRHPALVERMRAEGHSVQVHGQRHWLVPVLGPVLTARQLLGAATQLRQRFGLQTCWYRPTWGLCNAVTLALLPRSGHRLVLWSVMVGDWRRTPAAVLLARIAERLQPGGIIVLHDSDETFGAEAGAPESVIQLIPLLSR